MRAYIYCETETPNNTDCMETVIEMEFDEFFDVDIPPPHIEDQIEKEVRSWFESHYTYGYNIRHSKKKHKDFIHKSDYYARCELKGLLREETFNFFRYLDEKGILEIRK